MSSLDDGEHHGRSVGHTYADFDPISWTVRIAKMLSQDLKIQEAEVWLWEHDLEGEALDGARADPPISSASQTPGLAEVLGTTEETSVRSTSASTEVEDDTTPSTPSSPKMEASPAYLPPPNSLPRRHITYTDTPNRITEFVVFDVTRRTTLTDVSALIETAVPFDVINTITIQRSYSTIDFRVTLTRPIDFSTVKALDGKSLCGQPARVRLRTGVSTPFRQTMSPPLPSPNSRPRPRSRSPSPRRRRYLSRSRSPPPRREQSLPRRPAYSASPSAPYHHQPRFAQQYHTSPDQGRRLDCRSRSPPRGLPDYERPRSGRWHSLPHSYHNQANLPSRPAHRFAGRDY